MNEIKKHLIPLLLALAVCVGLLGVPAHASSSDFTIEGCVLTRYNGPGGDVVIPNSVTEIGDFAIAVCTSLASITIPDSVTEIRSSAFFTCTGLTSITIPNSVTEIGPATFQDCTSLTDGTEPDFLAVFPEMGQTDDTPGDAVGSGFKHESLLLVDNSDLI